MKWSCGEIKYAFCQFLIINLVNGLLDTTANTGPYSEFSKFRNRPRADIIYYILSQMEQFSRECLEIDTKVQSHERPDLNLGSSMDRVYDRAAKLVKRTLDVEGVIVMDVSHYEVLESMSAEGTVSVSMHYGDPQLEMTKRQLSTEEYHNLNLFFAKYPDGKISEGIIPPSFKPFLPTHIQYALSKWSHR